MNNYFKVSALFLSSRVPLFFFLSLFLSLLAKLLCILLFYIICVSLFIMIYIIQFYVFYYSILCLICVSSFSYYIILKIIILNLTGVE